MGFPGEFLSNGSCRVTENGPHSTAGGIYRDTLCIYYLFLSPFLWEARVID